jgi:hypothetical protein
MLGNGSTPWAFRCCGSSVSIARFRTICPEAYSSVSSALWTVSTIRLVPGQLGDVSTESCEKPSTSGRHFPAEAHRASFSLTCHEMHSVKRVDTLSPIVRDTCDGRRHITSDSASSELRNSLWGDAFNPHRSCLSIPSVDELGPVLVGPVDSMLWSTPADVTFSCSSLSARPGVSWRVLPPSKCSDGVKGCSASVNLARERASRVPKQTGQFGRPEWRP